MVFLAHTPLLIIIFLGQILRNLKDRIPEDGQCQQFCRLLPSHFFGNVHQCRAPLAVCDVVNALLIN